jgi:membrane protein DedA with SNARE-associated domain
VDRVVEAVIGAILGLRGPVVYWLVGILSWAEAAFFLGLVTPGELAMATGGVLASRGQAATGWVAFAAATGTILGNITGYWFGRIYGQRVLEWGPLRRRLGSRIDRAQESFRERGAWAIVVGRFASFLRIFIPFIAGASRMPFRRFILFDAPTGAAWSVLWVLLGFALGESWGLLRTYAGPAAFLVLVLFLFGLAIRWVALRLAAQQERIRALADRIAHVPAIAWVRRRFGTQLRWVGRRFDPRVARGLNLTVGFVVLLVGAGAVGLVLSQAAALRGLAQIDFPVLEWMGDARTDEAVAISRRILQVFEPPGMIPLVLAVLIYANVRLNAAAGARVAVGVLGSGFGSLILDRFLLEGLVPGAEFPSVPVAVAMSLAVHATAVAGGRLAWKQVVWTGAAGTFVVGTIALAAMVAGFAAPTGVVLGGAIGLTWSAGLEVQARIVASLQGVPTARPARGY